MDFTPLALSADISIIKESEMKARVHLVVASRLFFWVWLAMTLTTLVLNDADIFARSGSIAIVFAVLHYTAMQSLQARIADQRQRISTSTKVGALYNDLRAAMSDGSNAGMSETEFREHLKNMEKNDQQLSKLVDRNFSKEAVMLTLGTLQWGFGDLILGQECMTC